MCESTAQPVCESLLFFQWGKWDFDAVQVCSIDRGLAHDLARPLLDLLAAIRTVDKSGDVRWKRCIWLEPKAHVLAFENRSGNEMIDHRAFADKLSTVHAIHQNVSCLEGIKGLLSAL